MSWTYYVNPSTGEYELDEYGQIRMDHTAASLVLFTLRKAGVIELIRDGRTPTTGAIREAVRRALEPLMASGRITDIDITISTTRPLVIRTTVTDGELGGPVATEVSAR